MLKLVVAAGLLIACGVPLAWWLGWAPPVLSPESIGQFPLLPTGGTTAEVPSRWRALDGRRVLIDGYRVPSFADAATPAGGVAFQIVGFASGEQHGSPEVKRRVFCHSARPLANVGELARFAGTLHVGVTRDPETSIVTSVYTMDVDGITGDPDGPATLSRSVAAVADAGWVTAGVAIVGLAAVRVASGRRERRAKFLWLTGHCPQCGDDLRKSSVGCPECGWSRA